MRTSITLALLFSLMACQAPATRAPAFEVALAVDTIGAEIAVLDVVNSTHGALVPTTDLRRLFRTHLLDGGFTPLSEQYVDSYANRQQVDAAIRIPGASVMSLQILAWKDSNMVNRGQLDAQVDFVLYSPDGVVQYRSAGLVELELAATQLTALNPDGRVEALHELLVTTILSSFPQPEPL